MRIAVAGATGNIGCPHCLFSRAGGHMVVPISRSLGVANAEEHGHHHGHAH
jgi:hypothetical protein